MARHGGRGDWHNLWLHILIDPETHAAVRHNAELPAARCGRGERRIKPCREQIHAWALLCAAQAGDGRSVTVAQIEARHAPAAVQAARTGRRWRQDRVGEPRSAQPGG